MSKLAGYFSYKDWCILKHALKDKVEIREAVIASHEEDKIYVEETKIMKKELEEEKRTLERITKLTDNYEKYIHGNERHAYYEKLPFDCK